jgi:hypothetical protein
MNVGRPRIVRTSAKEDAIIAAVERAPWKSSRDIAIELELLQLRDLELLLYDQRHPSIPLHAQKISFPRRSFSTADAREWLRLSPKEDNILHTTFCGQMKRAVCQTIWSAFTSHLWARDNHNFICEWGIDAGFRVKAWVGTIRNNAVGPYLLPERLTARQYWDFLESDILGLQVLPLAVRQIWCQHAAGTLLYGEDVQKCLNRTYLCVEELASSLEESDSDKNVHVQTP